MREVTIAYGMTETSPISFQSRPRRSDRAARLDRRAHPAAYRGQDRRCRRTGRAARHRRRIVHARLLRDARLLGGCRAHRGIDRRRRLDAFRRPRHHRRRRLLQHRRPREGHADPRRRERLPARDRGVSLSPSQGAGRAGVRRAGSRATARPCALSSCSRPGQSASAEEIRAFCAGQIAHFKIPQHIRFVPDFPITATGKPQKFVMREQMMRELGVVEQKTA